MSTMLAWGVVYKIVRFWSEIVMWPCLGLSTHRFSERNSTIIENLEKSGKKRKCLFLAYALLIEDEPRKQPSKMTVTYLKARHCPKCRAKVVMMLLRYTATMSSISGICRRCDHSLKWLLLRGKAAAAATSDAARGVAGPILEKNHAVKLR